MKQKTAKIFFLADFHVEYLRTSSIWVQILKCFSNTERRLNHRFFFVWEIVEDTRLKWVEDTKASERERERERLSIQWLEGCRWKTATRGGVWRVWGRLTFERYVTECDSIFLITTRAAATAYHLVKCMLLCWAQEFKGFARFFSCRGAAEEENERSPRGNHECRKFKLLRDTTKAFSVNIEKCLRLNLC